MNLLHEEAEGPMWGEFELMCELRGRGEREYVFHRLRVGDKTFDRVLPKRFTQWRYLVPPTTVFSQVLEGTQWKGIGYLRRSRIAEEKEGFLRWVIVVNEPVETAPWAGVRLHRREYELDFFVQGVGGDASKLSREGREGGPPKAVTKKKKRVKGC
jgi:hypothetical protein